MKYIRHKELGIVIFCSSIDHKKIAQLIGKVEDVVSAGSIVCTDLETLSCQGCSVSLGLECHKTDTVWLRSRLDLAVGENR